MTPSVLVDLRAVQSPDHRGRGIGRWSYEFASALERVCPDLVSAYLLDGGWPPPGTVDGLLSSGKLMYYGSAAAEEAIATAHLYHCCSPFELGRPISAVRPRFVDESGLAYSAVAYDLIPLRHPEHYLVHPGQRRRYRARLEVLRSADAVLAISSLAGADVEELLGVEAGRCHVVGTGVSRHFVPPPSREEALQRLQKHVPALTDRFVLYPGGNDGRKNIDGLISAFSALPAALLDRYQLVVVGDLPPLTANHYRHLARLARIERHLVLTGFVSDERLTELYQGTDLFVFPSIAEGYGLPVAEALACGAVAAVADRSPLDELVAEPSARFDPLDRADMADTIARCLTDGALRAEVLRAAASVVTSWDDVGRRAADVFEGLVARRPRPWKRRRRVAIVSPFPPAPSGVAGYSTKLVEAAGRVAANRRRAASEQGGVEIEFDCFADGLVPGAPPSDPVGEDRPRDARAFEVTDGAIGAYDDVVYVLGNSEFHSNALAALRRRPGLVVSHDVRLSGLLSLAQETPGAVPGGLEATIARAYPELSPRLGAEGYVTAADRDRYGLLLLRDVLPHTRRLLVSSESARHLAVLDAGPGLAPRIGVLPFAMSRLSSLERAAVGAARLEASDQWRSGERRRTIASFGIVDPSKRPDTLVSLVAELAASGTEVDLLLVGPISDALAAELRELADALGVDSRVELTGNVAWDRYLELLGRADMAVQLRSRFFGEASGAVSECLSAGLPTVVSDLGWMHELADDAVCKVPHECSVAELASSVSSLLSHDAARARLGAAGEAYASARTFEVAAEALLDELSL